MTTVFADAFYYFALVNPADDRHKKAVAFTANFTGRVVTTAWVMTEVADGLAKLDQRLERMEKLLMESPRVGAEARSENAPRSTL